MKPWHAKSTDQVLQELDTDQKKGLTSQQAAKRLEEYGLNQLESKEKESLLKRFLGQMKP